MNKDITLEDLGYCGLSTSNYCIEYRKYNDDAISRNVDFDLKGKTIDFYRYNSSDDD